MLDLKSVFAVGPFGVLAAWAFSEGGVPYGVVLMLIALLVGSFVTVSEVESVVKEKFEELAE